MPEDYKGSLSQYLTDPAVRKQISDRETAIAAIKRNIPIYGQNTISQNTVPSGSIFSAPVIAPVIAPAVTPVETKPVTQKTVPPGIKSLVNKPAVPPAEAAKELGVPKEDINSIDAYLKRATEKLEGNPEDAKQARKDAFNQRLLQAGLEVMGGQSSNWAQNMSLASKAAAGYGEDIKGLRAEEQAKLTQLAGLGLKGVALKQEAEKLGITKQHYADWYKAHMAQVNETAGVRSDANKLRAETALENRITTYAGKLLTLPKYQDNPDLAYADAQKAVTGQSAANQFTGFSGSKIK
jgi:hypothetical protein